MKQTEAFDILTTMRANVDLDVHNLKTRLPELRHDYAKDPWEDTATQIKRLEDRLARRIRESDALGLALAKMDGCL